MDDLHEEREMYPNLSKWK